ncbi:ATP-binding cassette domain-containing protein [Roseivirga misakiensis]|uniref:ABC transporter domain-containing protein n=1 Tax=Roseivirga misakiensis TaxID=1563681 RepID=A0A1E5T3A2_9BACT|nr:ATP-binding cassette domain-containing protein [Roseivirga misakiensis]OEK05747.1 hypothetical protein BFP71_06390 [Roseivirga misakiensis]
MKLEVDGVFFEVNGKTILSDIYLDLKVGEVVGLLGRNGSGKTTLFDLIFGARKADDMSVRIDGRPYKKPFKNQLLQYLPQYGYLPNFLTISSAFEFMGITYKAIEGLSDCSPKTKIGHLSFGQKRLVEIQLLLESKSTFVLLDEPFSGLSPLSIEIISAKIESEKDKKGIFITDHMYGEILSISDRLMVMESGTLKQIEKDPTALEFAGYLSST